VGDYKLESYVFRAANGHIGYLQIEDDGNNCFLLLNKGQFNLYGKHQTKISDAQRQLDSPHNDLSWLTTTDKMERIISVLCWINGNYESKPVSDVFKNTAQGNYHPRNIRDTAQFSGIISSPPKIDSELINEVRAFSSIATNLSEIFDYLEPDVNNLYSFGNKLRELLILSCNEVEYLWLKFLQANSYATKKSYATCDYIKCLPHLKLNDYTVQFTLFPLLGDFSPFSGWHSQLPTQSLQWYDAYNSVKHNRGDNLPKANLLSLINAIAAIFILLESQHGLSYFSSKLNMPNTEIFNIINKPIWATNEIAMPLLDKPQASWTTPIAIVL